MTRIVVDPITRIEGHLRIEAVVENGVITDAFSAGTMVRGLEKILIGRDPRDAWAICERVCGVCTTVHALTSIRAVEDAFGITVPPTAELIRNIMMATQYVQDHVIHFYHLHALDWVDIVNALKADPKKAAELAQSFSKWDKNTPAYFSDVQDKIKAFAASGLGIFANGYWGHPAYKLPPEVNLIAVAHYLDALSWQKEIVKIHTVFGGKNPHPNYLVGGVPCSINMNEVAAINSERLNLVAKLISGATIRWINCQPDTCQRVYFANHTSHLAALILWCSLPREVRDLTRPVAAKDYWDKGPIRRHIARTFNAAAFRLSNGARIAILPACAGPPSNQSPAPSLF